MYAGIVWSAWVSNRGRDGALHGSGVYLTLTLHASPAEAPHQSRNEVLHSLRTSDENEHEALCPHSPVAHGHLESDPMWDMLDTTALRKANPVSRKSVACEDALFLVEEARFA